MFWIAIVMLNQKFRCAPERLPSCAAEEEVRVAGQEDIILLSPKVKLSWAKSNSAPAPICCTDPPRPAEGKAKIGTMETSDTTHEYHSNGSRRCALSRVLHARLFLVKCQLEYVRGTRASDALQQHFRERIFVCGL